MTDPAVLAVARAIKEALRGSLMNVLPEWHAWNLEHVALDAIAAYEAARTGQPPPLPPASADVATHKRRLR